MCVCVNGRRTDLSHSVALLRCDDDRDDVDDDVDNDDDDVDGISVSVE